MDGSSVRMIISLYIELIVLFVDGTVSSAINYKKKNAKYSQMPHLLGLER